MGRVRHSRLAKLRRALRQQAARLQEGLHGSKAPLNCATKEVSQIAGTETPRNLELTP
jgi:hypothetical protein